MKRCFSKIYTRTGRQGTTGLSDGTPIAKDHSRVEVIGTVDELNSAIGTVQAYDIAKSIHECLEKVQLDLFDFFGGGGDKLCIPERSCWTLHECTPINSHAFTYMKRHPICYLLRVGYWLATKTAVKFYGSLNKNKTNHF